MKKFLRKWLEVPEVPEVPDMQRYANTDNVRMMVEDAIREALLPDLPNPPNSLYWSRPRDRDIRNALANRVRDLFEPEVIEAVENAVSEIVDPEGFIDNVIKRIKRKQLS